MLEASDGNRFAAFLATPEEPERRRRRHPPRRPRALPLLRGARAPLRRARATRRSRSTISDARPGSRSATTTSSTWPHVQETTPDGVQRDVAAAVAQLRSPRAAPRVRLHRRLLLRRPAFVARDSGGTRPRGRGRFLRAARARSGRLTRARLSVPREFAAPILALQGGEDADIPVEDVRRSTRRSTAPASSTRS